jgi:hypothetical protein
VRSPLLLAAVIAAPAWAQPAPSPFGECDAAISAASKGAGRLPDKLLPAIARVESGRLDPATGKVRPWPWTINVEGTGYFYDTKEQVISAVQAFQARGIRSIDVGCMQVNLLHHPKAFADLDQAFDPAANARYAVRFLSALYQQARDWHLATAWYHSQVPDRGEEYQRLVFGRVLAPMGGSGGGGGRAAGPYPVWPPPGERFAAIPPINFSFGAFSQPRPAMAAFGARAQTASFGGTRITSVQSLSLGPAAFGGRRR